MTGIERHWWEEKIALLKQLEEDHLPYMQQIYMLRYELYGTSNNPQQNLGMGAMASAGFVGLLAYQGVHAVQGWRSLWWN